MQCIRPHRQIVGKAPGAAQQIGVFEAADRTPGIGGLGARCPGSRRRSSTSSTRTSFSAEFRPALLVKGLDAFAEIVRAAQPAVAWPSSSIASDKLASSISFISFFALRCANGGKPRSSSTSRIARRFKFGIGDALGRDAPFIGLATGNAPRAHDDVLGPGDADHLLQPRGAARTRGSVRDAARAGNRGRSPRRCGNRRPAPIRNRRRSNIRGWRQ